MGAGVPLGFVPVVPLSVWRQVLCRFLHTYYFIYLWVMVRDALHYAPPLTAATRTGGARCAAFAPTSGRNIGNARMDDAWVLLFWLVRWCAAAATARCSPGDALLNTFQQTSLAQATRGLRNQRRCARVKPSAAGGGAAAA